MPGDNPGPRIWIAAEVDLRDAKTAVPLFTRGGGADVTIADAPDYVDDVTDILNGRGSHSTRTMSADHAATWAGAGTVVWGLDANDRVYIESDTEDFVIEAHANNTTWGFTAAEVPLVGGGAPFRQTATADWVRGVVDDKPITVTPAAAGASTIPSIDARGQSVIHMMRGRGAIADADDINPSNSIEVRDNAQYGTAHNIRWRLDPDGFVECSWPTSAIIFDPDWGASAAAVAFRNYLGFTGDESSTTSGNLKVFRATYPCAGVLAPTRAYVSVNHAVDQTANAVQLTSGACASNLIASIAGGTVRFYLDGPQDAYSDGAAADLHEHWLRSVLPHLPPGGAFELYQDAGDPRRAIRSRAVNAAQSAYTVLSTSELNGDVGRLRLYRSPSDSPGRKVDWAGALRRRVDTSLAFIERP